MDQTIYNKARRDKFQMIFDIPVALKNKALNTPFVKCNADTQAYLADSIQFSIYGTPVPRVSVREVDIPYLGQTHRQTSYTRPSYTPLTIGMAVDNKFLNYWLLWSWLNLWNDSQDSQFDGSSINVSPSIADYVAAFTIYGLDEYNNRVISFSYKNVIITDLSEIEFSYKNTEEIGCTATFVFDQLNVELLQTSC